MQLRINIKEYARRIFCISLALVIITGQFSCKKYLDKKPRQGLAIPTSLNDLQAVLDNSGMMNYGSPGLLELVADNYYLDSSSWSAAGTDDRASYTWGRDARTDDGDWRLPYVTIYNANFVLDYLPKISISESGRSARNSIEGSALFYRSFMFYQLAQAFCRPYSSSAATDPGIVLRLTSDVQVPSSRATVQQTYDKVTSDLKTAADLLPVTTLFSTRPNKAAAFGMLARVYLSMRDYANAALYANASLALNSALLDYNSLTPANDPVLPSFLVNPEVLFFEVGHMNTGLMNDSKAIIDSFLYQSYHDSDLRKTVFFRSGAGTTHYWRGCYAPEHQTYWIFDGIATDEIYLIRAECRARAGNKDSAMADLNSLLRKRWKGTFTDLGAIDATDALNKILVERRKELLFRGLRWTDLRRFNLEGANDTLKRIINGTTYTLPPNDLRWVLLIPDQEISRSGIPQNPR